jgi:hypothetical protein
MKEMHGNEGENEREVDENDKRKESTTNPEETANSKEPRMKHKPCRYILYSA